MSLNFDEMELEPEVTDATANAAANLLEMELEPEAAAGAVTEAFAAVMHKASAPVEPEPLALMQVLPADFPLPILTRFCPNPALRAAVDEAAKYALSIEVKGPEGLQRGDAACTALRVAIKNMEADFEEPKDIANRLHKQITGTLAEWSGPGKTALQTVGGRVATETRRQQQEEQERRRKAQEEEDRKERERLRLEAEAAEKAKAPAPVVAEMKRQAQTATAPPVTSPAPATKLTGSTVVGTWKPRLKGESEGLPSMDALTPAQREHVNDLLRAILAGAAPIQCLAWGESYLSKRAKADKSTLDIPGIEAHEDIGLRGKSSRAK